MKIEKIKTIFFSSKPSFLNNFNKNTYQFCFRNSIFYKINCYDEFYFDEFRMLAKAVNYNYIIYYLNRIFGYRNISFFFLLPSTLY